MPLPWERRNFGTSFAAPLTKSLTTSDVRVTTKTTEFRSSTTDSLPDSTLSAPVNAAKRPTDLPPQNTVKGGAIITSQVRAMQRSPTGNREVPPLNKSSLKSPRGQLGTQWISGVTATYDPLKRQLKDDRQSPASTFTNGKFPTITPTSATSAPSLNNRELPSKVGGGHSHSAFEPQRPVQQPGNEVLSNKRNSTDDQVISVSGKQKCAHCGNELGE